MPDRGNWNRCSIKQKSFFSHARFDDCISFEGYIDIVTGHLYGLDGNELEDKYELYIDEDKLSDCKYIDKKSHSLANSVDWICGYWDSIHELLFDSEQVILDKRLYNISHE